MRKEEMAKEMDPEKIKAGAFFNSSFVMLSNICVLIILKSHLLNTMNST